MTMSSLYFSGRNKQNELPVKRLKEDCNSDSKRIFQNLMMTNCSNLDIARKVVFFFRKILWIARKGDGVTGRKNR